ncbi:alpha/beta fold hydrolase [Haladaptatus sp. DFWS20]|uniref:alpha/beta fold hydrolase n=1 Tax=Haladaptatus sp. DFWS20 TaxID=3403467 RepID=UPI003EB9A995
MSSRNTTADDRTPAWVDRELYPFQSNYMAFGPGRLHYIDEGEGHPIVMLHGNPTWSFLYRDLVRGLSDEYRCIVPDYFGFGLSDKPRGWSYRPEDHARIFEAFVEELRLQNFTLIVQDWGGPIGLSYALSHPEKVSSLVIMNTFMWPAENRRMRAFSTILGSPFGRYLIRKYNLFADQVVKRSFAERSRLTPRIHRHYLEPLATPDDREASWVFPREITGSEEWLRSLWNRRANLGEIPALLLWPMGDVGFGIQELRRWQALFPDARTVEFEDSGHYIQEEKGPELVPEIQTFLAEEGD